MGFKARDYWCYVCSLTGKCIYRISTSQIAAIKASGSCQLPFAADEARRQEQRNSPASGKVMALVCSPVPAHPTAVPLRGAPASLRAERGSERGVGDPESHGD